MVDWLEVGRALPDAVHRHQLHGDLSVQDGLRGFSTQDLAHHGLRRYEDHTGFNKLGRRVWS